MLFQSLGKIKRTTRITAIILMALGVVMLLCPELNLFDLISNKMMGRMTMASL